LGASALTAASWPAQTWPQRTVRVIVPNPPGVGLDVIARLFAERLADRWRQPVIVENVPGADGILAAREFVAKRDDHTLLYSFAGLISINPLLHEKLPYDPDRDLVPIASTSENALAIAVSAALGGCDMRERKLKATRGGRHRPADLPALSHVLRIEGARLGHVLRIAVA
jgi:tripartite-type tricarboxylate transporter receptor subunit TctC